MKYGLLIRERPLSKQRPRFGNGHTYTPSKTKEYEERVGYEWKKKYKDCLTGAVSVTMKFFFHEPKKAGVYKTSRPDIDNLAKAILDGLNGIAFTDDSQVVELHLYKLWGEPRTEVIVFDLERS